MLLELNYIMKHQFVINHSNGLDKGNKKYIAHMHS